MIPSGCFGIIFIAVGFIEKRDPLEVFVLEEL
jgi:hypothetical protein